MCVARFKYKIQLFSKHGQEYIVSSTVIRFDDARFQSVIFIGQFTLFSTEFSIGYFYWLKIYDEV